jgi:ABC-type transport system involved in cytochrome c biogenesis permease subunit
MLSDTFLHILEILTTAGYLATTAAYLWFFLHTKERAGQLAARTFVAAAAVHTLWGIAKGIRLGYFPLANWFDCVSFIAWALAVGYVYIELSTKDRRMGVFVVPVVAGFQLLALLWLLANPVGVDIPESLKSGWFGVHLGSSVFACSAFSLSFCFRRRSG